MTAAAINLDAVTSEYRPNGATAIENDLILNWYPERIIKRFGHCGSLLELGIGHGYTPSIFNAACDRHVIIEGSQVVIDLFNEKSPDFSGEVVFSYFEDFDTEERFDVIVMGFVLEHVEDPGLVLDRFRKFLKPGGKLFAAVPNAKSMNRRLGVELGKIDDIYSLNANDLALGHRRQYCRDTFQQELERHGYSMTYQEGIYLKPLPLGVLKTLPDFQENLEAMLRVGIEFPDLCVALLMEAEAA
jgi:SAM-dependent methyltransferase